MKKKYKKVYSLAHKAGYRNYTVQDLLRLKGKKKLTQINVISAEEAYAAESAGIDGVVCSPHELELVTKRDSLLSITPGIRLQDSKDDQKRVMTPKEAIELGADYLVIGRPITKSKDIKKSLNEIYQNLR